LLGLLAGCSGERDLVTYVCEEPLEKYLIEARENIAKDYEVERSSQVLTDCPGRGFHRRYVFSFQSSAIASKQAVAATVRASWCGDLTERSTKAELTNTPSTLTFRFDYPWSTSTGKYPRTEFRLNRSRMKGGFFEDLDWNCRLEQAESGAP
jgi:hypothetical protein